MIQASELRIGNWLDVEEYNGQVYFERREWKLGDFYWILEGGGDDEKDLPHKPIPLTEEWPEKFGFEKQELKQWKGNGADYQPETSRTQIQSYVRNGVSINYKIWQYRKNEDDEWISEHSVFIGYNEAELYIPLDFVHQLQNAIHALTGEELKLK